jgi:hypothetical protein
MTRTIEIQAVNGTNWTIEIQPEFERRIAVTMGRDPYEILSDEEIKEFFVNSIMNEHEMLSLEIVKG